MRKRYKEMLRIAMQRYPKTLDYIERVYGLTYDRELFSIDYQVQGSKIPPIIKIERVEEKK